MPEYFIRGINVTFPYEAYTIQIDYMTKVIEALQERKSALLESPTGTGKTLCLLCACLAWRQNRYFNNERSIILSKNNTKRRTIHEIVGDDVKIKQVAPPIIYASRTHSQLSQAIKEIRKIDLKIKCTILGSREKQCSNPTLRNLKGLSKSNACGKLIKTGKCNWHTRFKLFEDDEEFGKYGERAMDIEDLHEWANKTGKDAGPCPYYFTRKLAEDSDIIFIPYNYIIDANIRKGFDNIFNSGNFVLILDEAHNIEQACTDASSFDLYDAVISNCTQELKKSLKICNMKIASDIKSKDNNNNNDKPSKTNSWSVFHERCENLIGITEKLTSALNAMSVNEDGKTERANKLFDLFSGIGISEMNWKALVDALNDVSEVLSDATMIELEDKSSKSTSTNSCSVMANALQKMFVGYGVDSCANPISLDEYRMHVHVEKGMNAISHKVLSYWCFSPALAYQKCLRELRVQTTLMTSGTLSPMSSMVSELKAPFPIQFSNNHIISKNQVSVNIVLRGPKNHVLNSSYNNRCDKKYISDLGLSILNFIKLIPDGVLVFFPSYTLLNSFTYAWQDKYQKDINIWNEMKKCKELFIEPREADKFFDIINKYKQNINSKKSKGAVFFSVCRGKASEGIDFSDKAARAVIIVGIPYAQINDPKIKLKKDILKDKGNDWYCQSAFRSVNQAMGRVIRHLNDYGAIIMLDERFRPENNKKFISKWLRDVCMIHEEFNHALNTIDTFFKNVKNINYHELRGSIYCHQSKLITNDNRNSVIVIDKKPNSVKRNREIDRSENDIIDLTKGDDVQEMKIEKIASNVKKLHASDKAIDFIKYLKKNLKRSSFEKIKDLLEDYRLTRNIETYIKGLRIVSEEIDNSEVLMEISKWVPKKYKNEYMKFIELRNSSYA